MLSASNYLKSAILYTKKKHERIGTDIFTSYCKYQRYFYSYFNIIRWNGGLENILSWYVAVISVNLNEIVHKGKNT